MWQHSDEKSHEHTNYQDYQYRTTDEPLGSFVQYESDRISYTSSVVSSCQNVWTRFRHRRQDRAKIDIRGDHLDSGNAADLLCSRGKKNPPPPACVTRAPSQGSRTAGPTKDRFSRPRTLGIPMLISCLADVKTNRPGYREIWRHEVPCRKPAWTGCTGTRSDRFRWNISKHHRSTPDD